MGVADFPIEIFRTIKKEHTLRKENTLKLKTDTTHSSGENTPSGTASNSQSQLDLYSEDSKTINDDNSRHESQSSSATPKTTSEDTIRSSIEVPSTPLSSISSPSEHRGGSMKQALRGALQRSGSRSGSRGHGSLSRSNSLDRKPGSRSSSPFRHRRSNTTEFDPSKLTLDNVTRAGKGVSRIVGAGLKSPMDFTLGIARGFHNAPKLYGDDTVRPQAKVTDFQSGLKAAGKVNPHFLIT
jgi:hypothetical protein